MQNGHINFNIEKGAVFAHRVYVVRVDSVCRFTPCVLSFRFVICMFTCPPPRPRNQLINLDFHKQRRFLMPYLFFCVLVLSLRRAVAVRVFLLHWGMCPMHVILVDCKTADISCVLCLSLPISDKLPVETDVGRKATFSLNKM